MSNHTGLTIADLIALLIYAVLVVGVIGFWALVIYALYLLVTGQLHIG